jgi:hypothetical protein
MPDKPAQRPLRRVLGGIAILLSLSALVVFALFVHWAIITGRAKRQRADAEYQAVQDIRLIFHAQREYYARNQYLGFPCTLQVLGGMPKADAPQTDPTTTAAQLLEDPLASGHANGYTFALSQCTHVENVGFNGSTTYHLTAVPDHPGSSGFCVDDNVDFLVPGELVYDNPDIRMDPTGGANCTQAAPNP